MITEEKNGRVSQILQFREAIEECYITDLRFTGELFTWVTSVHMGVKKHLDRVFVSQGWKDKYHAAVVRHLNPFKSNHIPIFLEVRSCPIPSSRRRSMFYFKDLWMNHEECKMVIQRAWDTSVVGVPFFQVCEKIKVVWEALLKCSMMLSSLGKRILMTFKPNSALFLPNQFGTSSWAKC